MHNPPVDLEYLTELPQLSAASNEGELDGSETSANEWWTQ